MSITAYEVFTGATAAELANKVDTRIHDPERPLDDSWQPWGPMYVHLQHTNRIAGEDVPVYEYCQAMVKYKAAVPTFEDVPSNYVVRNGECDEIILDDFGSLIIDLTDPGMVEVRYWNNRETDCPIWWHEGERT